MTLDEYKSLATLPLGVKIQWQNILLELSAPLVDFKKVETAMFFLQIISQAGPPQDRTDWRQSHSILSDPVFAIALLTRIEQGAERFKENWEMVHGISILISLVLRILSLAPSPDVQDLSLGVLRCLRQAARDWIDLVREKASHEADDKRKTYLTAKSIHIALVCSDTFNAEDLTPIFATPSDISTLSNAAS